MPAPFAGLECRGFGERLHPGGMGLGGMMGRERGEEERRSSEHGRETLRL